MNSLIEQDKIKYNLRSIQDVIENIDPETRKPVKINSNNPHQIADKLVELQNILSLSVVVQASCKFFLENKKKDCFKELISEISILKVNLAKELVNSYCANELSAYELAERQNRAIVHQIDALRSVLSFLKSEVQNLK